MYLYGMGGQSLYPTQTDVTRIVSDQPQMVAGIGDDDSGEEGNARIRVTIHRSGLYFIRTRKATTPEGTYTLYAKDTNVDGSPAPRGSKQTRSAGNQDLPNFITSNDYVQVHATATGNISTGDDVDVFEVRLEGRTGYEWRRSARCYGSMPVSGPHQAPNPSKMPSARCFSRM